MADGSDLGAKIAAFRKAERMPCQSVLEPAQCAATRSEIDELVRCVERALSELAELGTHDLVERHIPQASAELGAVVPHIEAATLSILEQCERLERRFAGTPADAFVQAAATQIYQACTFQDITGQRIGKVAQLLRTVEQSMHRLLWVYGRPGTRGGPGTSGSLLAGPQLGDAAMSQNAIDELMEAS